MNTKTNNKAQERDEVEALLPWHAAGTLSRRDTQRVEAALAEDAGLRRNYSLVREELGGTIHLNETLGAPSARAMERLLAGIERESGPAKKTASRLSLSAWISEKMAAFSPRTLSYAAAAAAVIIVAQAGVLTSLYVGDRDPLEYRSVDIGPYGTATQPAATDLAIGSFAFIGFVPQATAADVTSFLAANNVVLVDGPRAGGLYRVRLAPKALSKDEVNALTARLRANRSVVSFVAPAE